MEDIQPDLEKQIVTVTCAEEVDEQVLRYLYIVLYQQQDLIIRLRALQALLESLQKWGAAAGKTVSLAA